MGLLTSSERRMLARTVANISRAGSAAVTPVELLSLPAKGLCKPVCWTKSAGFLLTLSECLLCPVRVRIACKASQINECNI